MTVEAKMAKLSKNLALEFKAIMDEHTNKVKTSTFFADVWIFLSEKQRNEMRELRDFSNSLGPVLHAHRSTIVP